MLKSKTSIKSITGRKKTCITCNTCNTCYTSGYTLIEILIGLTIISLLFSFGYASFRDFSRRQALSGVVKQIQGDLRLSQSSASAGQKPDDLFCNGSNTLRTYNFKVYSDSEYKIEVGCTGGTVVSKEVTLPSEVTISTPSPNPIQFKVLGQGTNIAAGSSAVITLTQKGTDSQATVTITAGGEIK